MERCHGRRSCRLNATAATFGGSPCPATVAVFLKTVYTCGE